MLDAISFVSLYRSIVEMVWAKQDKDFYPVYLAAKHLVYPVFLMSVDFRIQVP